MGAPVLIGAGIGAVGALATGGDPLRGAALGGLSGGAFGGAEGFGSGFTEGGLFNLGSGLSDIGIQGATGAATPSLGSGGYAAASGAGSAATSGAGAAGLSTSKPITDGGYSTLLGGDTILDQANIGMGNVVADSANMGVGAVDSSVGMVGTAPGKYPNFNPEPVTESIDPRLAGGYSGETGGGFVMSETDKLPSLTGGGVIDEQNKSIFDLMDDERMMDYGMAAAQGLLVPPQEQPLVSTPNLPPIQRKQVNPATGNLLTINPIRNQNKPKFF